MARALQTCTEPTCPELVTRGACPTHARPTWRNSTRAQRLPDHWPTTRRRILNRDHHTCQLNYPGCTGHATEVDHVTAGDNHDDANLQSACNPCHRIKSSREGGQAKKARYARRA